MSTLIHYKNGVEIAAQEFPTHEEAEAARGHCLSIVDEAIMNLESLNDSSVEGAIKELAQETFEVREMVEA